MTECADAEVVLGLDSERGPETRLERSAEGGRQLAAEHCGLYLHRASYWKQAIALLSAVHWLWVFVWEGVSVVSLPTR